ncbi:MAG TPA: alpha/beta hydrolase-fold protein, partial [Vicinamibacterales bacterium]|nr:alpha/beta hydrolase-fold protein [Vicinamibacterales bacterium]
MRKRAFAFLCLVGVSAAVVSAQGPVDYSLGPDSQPQAGVPKGTVTQHKLAPGKYYPGTTHDYQIYVPSQYNASRPTPFMIFLDGNGYAGDNIRIPVVFDNLIAKGQLPPMIGIFINPGVLPALSDQAQNRYERILQYDSLTPRFSSFLVDELIPEVKKRYNLSNDPNDRGIAGSSTGGVGAFVAAWNRPDQFRRVITLIGSFGNFRGADRLPGLIRKTEPKPIRVVMQTGRQDINNYAGSWYLENPRMVAALEFAGYDVKLELGEEGHNARHGAAVMPDMLRWLWRDYPQPIVVKDPTPGAGRGVFAELVPRRELIPAPPNPARQG